MWRLTELLPLGLQVLELCVELAGLLCQQPSRLAARWGIELLVEQPPEPRPPLRNLAIEGSQPLLALPMLRRVQDVRGG